MNKRINQAAKWERICKTVYQKVDLFSEAKHEETADVNWQK